MRRVLNPPFHDLKHLRIELGEAYKFYRMVELIDSLLWLAPHPNIISFINFDTQTSMKSIKVFNFLFTFITFEYKYVYHTLLLDCALNY